MMDLNAEQIAEITAYLDAATPLPERADLIFVFGTRLPDPAHLAAMLYAQGHAPYVVVTGGVAANPEQSEAAQHKAILIARGVPEERIIVEDRSTNTLENVILAIPLIEPLGKIGAVLAVCKWMHSRRALMTLKRHFATGTRYYAATYEPAGISRDNWPQDPRKFTADVLKEWELIPRWREQDFSTDLKRDGTSWI